MAEEMPDGNTAALRIKMAEDDRDDTLMVMAEARRMELVEEYMRDPSHTHRMQDMLADLCIDNPDVLASVLKMETIMPVDGSFDSDNMQSILDAASDLVQILRHHVDRECGHDLVDDYANNLAKKRHD